MNDISLFYIIFTDTEGMKEMLDNGISFKTCFKDYDGDDSITDVQSFVEMKFQQVMDDSNRRILAKNDNIIRKSSEFDMADMKPYKLQRAKTTPTHHVPIAKDNMSSLVGQKKLKCRFVSVIDHVGIKDVMNEIVKSSLMNKNALNTVVHSLTEE